MFYYRVYIVSESGEEYTTHHAITASITTKPKWYFAPFCLDKCKCRKKNKTDPCYVPANIKFAVVCTGREDVAEIKIERIA